MSLTEKSAERMKDESRFPKDEAGALIYKMLLQHCAEMDQLEILMQRYEAGEELDLETAQNAVREDQRQIHLEIVKRYPQFKYAGEMSYTYNREAGEPQMQAVDAEGNYTNFKVRHDLNRDAVIHDAFNEIFKHHTMVFEDGSYEFSWDRVEHEYEVTYKVLPDDGESQTIH